MGEILFLCGDNKRAAVATLSVIRQKVEGSEDGLKEEVTQICQTLTLISLCTLFAFLIF